MAVDWSDAKLLLMSYPAACFMAIHGINVVAARISSRSFISLDTALLKIVP
jgi:hypothetical protein